MLLDRIGRVDRHLVVGGIAILDTEVVILEIDIKIRQDQLLLDEGPDDPRHLIAIKFDDSSLDFDLAHLLPLLTILASNLPRDPSHLLAWSGQPRLPP
jgi:hypothetical protein